MHLLRLTLANRTPLRLYKAYRDLWKALALGEAKESALAKCEKVYGASIAARCRAAHSTPNGLFDPQIWPQCPNCEACALASSCLHDAIMHTWDAPVLRMRYAKGYSVPGRDRHDAPI